jgi:hypothetical protein
MSRNYKDVHEKDYGEPAFFGIIWGLIEIIWGIVELIISPWRKK